MGMFSWKCPHCDRGILGDGSTDTGINEWMNKAVVLLANGSIIKGDYDNYGRVGGMNITDHMHDAVMAHDACWRVAGKLDFEEYNGKGSKHDPDQGWGNDTDYDLKEPGAEIDEVRWQAALRLKAERLRRNRVKNAIKMLRPELDYEYDENAPKEDRYKARFQIGQMEEFVPTKDRPKDWLEKRVVGWYFYDKLDYGREDEGIPTEEEALALVKKLWDDWVASEEAAAILAEWRSWQQSAQDRWAEMLRKEGRYEADENTSYEERQRRERWFGVRDRAVYEYEGKFKTKAEAEEAAAKANSEWEAQSFPLPEKDLDEWDTCYSAIGCSTDYVDSEGINLLEESD